MPWKVSSTTCSISIHPPFQVGRRTVTRRRRRLPLSRVFFEVQQLSLVRTKSKDDDKRVREEQIRCESDLKRIYLYASRAIQTQDQTNLNRYALVKGRKALHCPSNISDTHVDIQPAWSYSLNTRRYSPNISTMIIPIFSDAFERGMAMTTTT